MIERNLKTEKEVYLQEQRKHLATRRELRESEAQLSTTEGVVADYAEEVDKLRDFAQDDAEQINCLKESLEDLKSHLRDISEKRDEDNAKKLN